MDETSSLSQLRHDLANPMSTILAEVQLLLLSPDQFPADVVESLRTIEREVLRMREMIRR